MFWINLCYNVKDIHKLLIKESYNDYTKMIISYKKKYPKCNGYYKINDYNKLDEEAKKEWFEHGQKQEQLKNIVIHNLLNYCKNYPHDTISKHRLIQEYDLHPEKLELNIELVLLDLYK